MDLKQFLDLFAPKPGNRYIQITDRLDATTDALTRLLEGVDGELRIVLYQDEPSESQKNIQYINNLKQPFRALPREHDCVIIKDILDQHKNPKLLLKIAYTTLANNANIIIMQKKGSMDIETLKEQLELLEFRSANYIDALDEFDLVIARKLHMWGNGL